MKKTIVTIILALFSLIGFSQKNLVGKQAPKIDIENWIYPKIQVADWHAREVPKDLNGRIIVLDFWFTHCAPCVASIPELNHLAKQYPEVVFISITFDEPDEIDKFLDKMVMYYPTGSDPDQKTIKAYGVSAFPETFLIDKDGVIQWQGSPFQLNKELLDELLGRERKMNALNLSNSELPFEDAAYSFSIQKHNLDMGQSTYYHFNPFDIHIFNKKLEDMLKDFYGINKSRMLTQDSTLLKTTYDITLEAHEEITTEANCFDMLKFLLPEQMGFELKEVVKDTVVDAMHIENDSLLNTHKSNSQYLGTSISYGNWQAKGATIENLIDFLEDNYLKLIAVKTTDDRKFDFIIPANDFEEAKNTLKKEYGLTLKSITQQTKLWRIKRNEK